MAAPPNVGRSSDHFLKVGSDANISSSERAALVRKGNEFFNGERYEAAKRVFLTVRYADGLVRLGDHYIKSGNQLEALRMFWIAGDRARIAELSEQIALVVRHWLEEDSNTSPDLEHDQRKPT